MNNISLSTDAIINIAIEGWKLSKLYIHNNRDRMAVKKFLHQFNVFMENCRVEIVDLTGQAFDPGMAVEVIFTEGQDNDVASRETIVEVIRPIVLIDCEIVKHGQVVTKKSC